MLKRREKYTPTIGEILDGQAIVAFKSIPYGTNHGTTISNPAVIAEVDEMHFGMTRGPQLARPKDYPVFTEFEELMVGFAIWFPSYVWSRGTVTHT